MERKKERFGESRRKRREDGREGEGYICKKR